MIVTLLTDFGTTDHFVGVMKGVLLSLAPGASMVDLSHGVEPGEVAEGAFALLAAYPHLPPGTVHLAVVDPGVGSERRALVVEAAGQRFVGPDNGLFSYLLDREPEAVVRAVADTRLALAREPLSHTFHGRDLFAPLAAALARGVAAEELGTIIHDPVRLAALTPSRDAFGLPSGRVLHIDRFGNVISSLSLDDLTHSDAPHLRVAGTTIGGLRNRYAGAPPGTPFLIEGSTGFVEISVNGGSAAALLGVRRGDPVREVVSDGTATPAELREDDHSASIGRSERAAGSDPLELPVRCAVAAVVRRDDDPAAFLAVRRPPDDDRLPNVWGLPAVSLFPGELPEEGLQRLGREKLDATLAPRRFIGIRAADRGDYLLILMDIEARVVDGEPDVMRASTQRTAYVEQQWTADLSLLADAARRGSVCSRIFLESAGVSVDETRPSEER